MQVGNFLRCARSGCTSYFQVGGLYPIVGFDEDNDPILKDHNGQVTPCGCPLDGAVWGFEVVEYDEQTIALLTLLEQSEEDVKSGRVMTREQLIERLKED